MFWALGCVTAAFKSVFRSSSTGTASVLVLGVGRGRDAAVAIEVALGPTAVLFSPLPLASPAQQKQLNIRVHPACFAGQLSCGMIYCASIIPAYSLPVHHLLICMMACIACTVPHAVNKSCFSRAVQAAAA